MRRLSSFVLVSLVACGGASKITAPPPPLRPTPVVQPAKPAKPVASAQTDCPPADPNKQLPAKTFGERSMDESQKLSVQGLATLQAAEGNADKASREKQISDAVDTFVTALLADPYNVNATYNLSAAYARIGRKQCAVNLIERLLQMRDHASQKVEVEAKIDRLLGRKKVALDPDFNDMRADQRFRDLIEKMCEGSSDAACVFGTQPGKHP